MPLHTIPINNTKKTAIYFKHLSILTCDSKRQVYIFRLGKMEARNLWRQIYESLHRDTNLVKQCCMHTIKCYMFLFFCFCLYLFGCLIDKESRGVEFSAPEGFQAILCSLFFTFSKMINKVS